MKKLSITFLTLTSVMLTFANALNAKAISTIKPLAEKYQHEISSEKLVLNNGAKWKVDPITNNNVNNLKKTLKGFDNGTNRSLKAYKKTGDYLQQGLVKMIAECRMEGPRHMALHKWLEPLMAQVAKLNQASTNAAAVKSIIFIRSQLNRYGQFFEL
ncbi:hypothetical protein [Mucilaginibacter sp.]|uniref:hypothetical protein n=1 Tax=Mucilaginibacter sp. TaxID=1882438 RepID=UPI002844B598|nr:hypothetical protein [Mucilaginibacter sp.]MDR3694787.1 hypothetical protein [Mucilaginibacter sp.]